MADENAADGRSCINGIIRRLHGIFRFDAFRRKAGEGIPNAPFCSTPLPDVNQPGSTSLLPVALFALSLVGCGGGSGGPNEGIESYRYDIPPDLTDGWSVGSLADVTIGQNSIVRMTQDIEADIYTGIDSVVIVRNGVLVHEAYFDGSAAGFRHDLRSATKSITSVLVGIAIDQGSLPDADAPALAYIAGLGPVGNWDDRKNDIRLRDFLTMSPGLDCNDSDPGSPGNEERMYRSSDWVQFIWNLPMLNDPGQTYAYCTGGVVVLGDLIAGVVGKGVDEYATSELFSLLQIDDYNWEYTPVGQVDTGGHIHMLSRDMAKLGQMMLDNGMWNGQRIVSEAWVEESTQQRLMLDANTGYGYLWWRRQFGPNDEHQSYYASGNGGQYIFVIPSLDTVIVFTGSNYNSSLSGQPLEIIEQYIVPAIQ
jgi:CubicO group peptidase (beta-lactamase class C family)